MTHNFEFTFREHRKITQMPIYQQFKGIILLEEPTDIIDKCYDFPGSFLLRFSIQR